MPQWSCKFIVALKKLWAWATEAQNPKRLPLWCYRSPERPSYLIGSSEQWACVQVNRIGGQKMPYKQVSTLRKSQLL